MIVTSAPVYFEFRSVLHNLFTKVSQPNCCWSLNTHDVIISVTKRLVYLSHNLILAPFTGKWKILKQRQNEDIGKNITYMYIRIICNPLNQNSHDVGTVNLTWLYALSNVPLIVSCFKLKLATDLTGKESQKGDAFKEPLKRNSTKSSTKMYWNRQCYNRKWKRWTQLSQAITLQGRYHRFTTYNLTYITHLFVMRHHLPNEEFGKFPSICTSAF